VVEPRRQPSNRDGLTLESFEVGAHPVLQVFLDRIGLRALIEAALGKDDPRLRLAHTDTILLLVRNFALSRHPLYGVPEWARRFAPAQLELSAAQLQLLNDDRLGRTLDRLFVLDRRTLLTRFVVRVVEVFGLELARMHNDSTSITFSGIYHPSPPRRDGRRRLAIVHGHNKDHRPDLKQLLWTLTVCADGAVPVHYNVDDGNVTDDRTHVATWKILRELIGRSDFLYVADSKLCSRENMGFIHGEGGRFITVLPRTRKEDAQLRQLLAEHSVSWQLIWERPPLRRQHDPPERFEALADMTTAEGYRLVWFRSSEKWKRDEQWRQRAIDRACFEIHCLRERVGRYRLKTREQVQAAVDQILDQTETRPWLRVELIRTECHHHRQAGRGRPGPNTRYLRLTTTVYEPVASVDAEAVRRSAAADGIFPLVTNAAAERLPTLELLRTYKYQPCIEKRHEQLKTAAEVVPVHFKSVERIEAFLFLYFLAITLHALIERQVRRAMAARGLRTIPLYPEERECRAPTADKILHAFEPLRTYHLRRNGRLVQTFADPLCDIQSTLLDLLNIPTSTYVPIPPQ
jgi:transposase